MTPLILALMRQGATPRLHRRGFLLGFLTGITYFAGTLYWLVETMTTYGGLNGATALFAAALLVAYLSLFPAVFGVVLVRLARSLGRPTAVMLAPPVWVATELGRQYIWDGFPWALVGYSQVSVLPIAQLASVVGVYGLSGLVALTSAAVALVVIDQRPRRWVVASAVVVLILGVTVWGRARIAAGSLASSGDRVRAAVLQGNVAQQDKWNPAMRDIIFSRYLSMTRQAVERGASFVIWPETSTPFDFEEDPLRAAMMHRIARELNITLLFGSDQIERVRPGAPAQALDNRFYNAAFLLKPDGTTAAVYRKMQLVPFGEYVPLQRMLFFVGPIIDAVSSFTPGDSPVLMPVDGHRVSTAICYEVIYGSLMRRFVRDGSELLTTITNDAWYGRSSAAYQHWDHAAMRAIENGRYLARAANTGVSGFVDPYGRVIEKSRLFEQALLVHDVRFVTARTIYTRIGDLAAWLSLAVTAVALLMAWRVG